MGLHTNIQWSDSTVNPTENCDGCELWKPGVKICYAGRMTERFRGLGAFDQPIVLRPGRMASAAKWSDLRGQARPEKPWIPAELPRLIFVSDMSDALSAAVSFEYLQNEIIQTVSAPPGDRHIWIWCTKRPKRMAQLSEFLQARGGWPPNLWVLCSVTDQKTADQRIPWLLMVGDEHTVRGISAEPLLGLVRLDKVVIDAHTWLKGRALDWVILGGVSGQNSDGGTFGRIAALNDQAGDLGIPCFVKQMGKDPAWSDSKGGDWREWPAAVQVRQFPRLKV